MATIDAWTAKPRERADLIGGWMHDYIDPVSGMAKTWTPDTPEPPNGVTEREIKYKRAWVWYLRDYNIRRVIDAARVYRTTGDTRYGEWAASQLDFYAANYASWPERTRDGKGHMFETGLDEATGGFTLLDAARLLEGYAGPARAGIWRSALFLPMAQNLKYTGTPLSNIGLWHAAAVAAIGMRYHDASLIDWGLNSSTGVRATLAASMTADYLWNEGSFSYNGYVIAALNSLYTSAALDGQSNLVQDEKKAMLRLLLAQFDYRFADGMLPTPSDASPQLAVDANQHLQSYRSAPTYWGVLKANAYQSWDILMDPPPAAPPAPSLPAPVTANFPANQMAMLRSGDWSAFVHYGQTTINHSQEEAPSYELYFGNTRISTDSGIVSYGSPYTNGYFRKAPANNMALVDGNGQSRWARGTVDQFDATNSRIAVTQPAYLPMASVSRDFKTASGAFTESTVIRTNDSLTHRLGVAFHTACTVAPLSGLTVADASSVKPPSNTATSYWKGMMPYRAAANWSVRLTCAGKTFSYSVQGPASQTVFLGQGPTTPLPATRAVLYYETAAKTAQFNAVITSN